MNLKTGGLFAIFFWCWFMGITAISIGFGALFPSMNLVAKPLVCPDGKMDLDKQVYNPYPGNTITTITWYCMDETSGTKKELGVFPMSLYAGTFYGVLLFVVVVIGMALLGNRKQGMPQGTFAVNADKLRSSEDTLSRMKELKDLRAANLISEVEYEQKRAEILKSL
jgi:hypothetical protein